jgi:hypothetical protein
MPTRGEASNLRGKRQAFSVHSRGYRASSKLTWSGLNACDGLAWESSRLYNCLRRTGWNCCSFIDRGRRLCLCGLKVMGERVSICFKPKLD